MQVGEAFQHAGRGEVPERALGAEANFDVVDDRTAEAPLGDRVRAGTDVEAHRHAVVLGRSPDRVVVARVVRATLGGVHGQHDRPQAQRRDPLDLLDGRLDLVHGDHRRARKARRLGGERLGEPVVVRAAARPAQLGIRIMNPNKAIVG